MIGVSIIALVVPAVIGGFFTMWGYVALQFLLRRIGHEPKHISPLGYKLLDLIPSGKDGDDIIFAVPDGPTFTVRRHWRLLAWEPRRQVRWGLLDLLLVVLLLFVGYFVASFILHQISPPAEGSELQLDDLAKHKLNMWADTAVKVGLMVVATLLIMVRTGTSCRDLGITWRHVRKDILIGLATFCMVAPIVYGIQAILTHIQPYEHPLIEMMKETPDVGLFWMLAWAAVILAPISEEWMFRVLLQGWLEKVFTYRGPTLDLILGGTTPIPGLDSAVDAQPLPMPEAAEARTLSPEAAGPDTSNPYTPPITVSESLVVAELVDADDAVYERPYPEAFLRHWSPIAISSLIFALMHYSHGLAWIPLTLLAAAMGYIYQRTHRILPSITVHFCLNGLSMAVFWVQMFEADKLLGK